jgi:D-amino peptidase
MASRAAVGQREALLMGLLAGVLLAAAPAGRAAEAPPKKTKVYISADMEGVGGVSTWTVQAGAKGREYEKFRQLMTREVNAAIAAAFEAGAAEVLVSDSHGDGQNLDVETLDRRAELIRGGPRPLSMMEGIDESFAAAVFVGYHAAEGDGAAALAHTMNGMVEIKLNGTTVGEAGYNAAIAGEFGVPVVFVSGDQTVTAAVARLLGPIETAAVKQAIGFQAVRTIHPEEARHRIAEGVRRGVLRRAEIKPWKLARPVKMEIRFKNVVDAELTSYLPGVERLNGNTVVFTARDMIEAARFFSAVEGLNTYHPE